VGEAIAADVDIRQAVASKVKRFIHIPRLNFTILGRDSYYFKLKVRLLVALYTPEGAVTVRVTNLTPSVV